MYSYDIDQKSNAFRYLIKTGYFDNFFPPDSDLSYPNPPSHYFPITLKKRADYAPWLQDKVYRWFHNCLGYEPRKHHPELFTCFDEIFINLEHAGDNNDCASVFMQYYPKKKQIDIAISDFGIGIPANIRKILPDADDCACILKAVEEGVSTKSTPRNRGSGLSSLIKIIANLGGSVYIYSLRGQLISSPGNISGRQHEHPYPGTLIVIKLSTSQMWKWAKTHKDEEDLEW